MKSVTINGMKATIAEDWIAYEDLVKLACEMGASRRSPECLHTVVYSFRNERVGLAGTLIPGESLQLRDGMIIDACVTDNA